MSKEILQEAKQSPQETCRRDLIRVIDSLPWPMCMIRPADGFIHYGNGAFADCFGWSERTEAEAGLSLWSILPEEQPEGETSRAVLRRFITQVMESPVSVTAKQEYLLPDGEEVTMGVTGTKIDYLGQPSVSLVLQDLSVRTKEAELLRRLADKEREANELKNKFIVNMSHEIRTPMNGIIGLADVQLQRTHDRENREAFKKISLSAKLLLAIVNDILDYSKMEAGTLAITKDEFVLENIMYEAMLTACERVREKKVEVLLKMTDDVPRKVIGDSVRVWQVVQNILDNSGKYTEEGSILLHVSRAEVGAGEQTLLFCITDTGRGMNREQLDKACLPFEQFDSSDWKNSGTGLGLPITRQLVELMGGTIRMDSKVGEGTVTEIRIPFGISEWDEPAIDKAAFKILVDKRVLVVDEVKLGVQAAVDILNDVGAIAEGIAEPDTVMKRVGEVAEEYDIIAVDHRIDKSRLKDLRSRTFTKTRLITFQKPYKPTHFLERLSGLLGGASSAYKIKNKKYHFPRAKVLICEDNVINQDVIMGVMGLFDIQAVTAVNGMEGIKWLEQEEFDLVIMDILMPVMDGHEATRAIRNSGKSFRDIPIVAMTANAMDEEMAVCMADGMNGYITKPIELERLYHELLKWLPVAAREEVEEFTTPNLLPDIEAEAEVHTQQIRLEKLGIDVDEVTKRFGGKYDLFCKSLRKFTVDIIKNGMMSIAEAAESEPEELRKYIHSLKGVTANLAIKEANRMLREIEQTIKDGTPDIGLYQQFYHHLNGLARDIMEVLGQEAEKTLEAGNWEECRTLLERLKELLLKARARECDQVIVLIRGKAWANVDAELLEKICGAVEEYDYAKALTILGQLLD